MDMASMTGVADWLPLLARVDAVVNAVGVLRERPGQPMAQVHTAAPVALFQACAQAGVRRVLQVSALGVDAGRTAYARTKRDADAALLALTRDGRLDGVVLRPSIVLGPGGASTALFAQLARWAVLGWPRRARQGRVQPLAVTDLAWGCANWLAGAATATTTAQRQEAPVTGLVCAVGPQTCSVAELVAQCRASLGLAPARVWIWPDALVTASAWLGDACPVTPWGRTTLELMAQDNVADAVPWTQLLGRPQQPLATTLAQAMAPLEMSATQENLT
jgi:nucleoside-diphosphate-sugar epimerase